VDELRPLHDRAWSVSERTWPGWLLAASLAHSGRRDEAAEVVAAALESRPGSSLATIASSLDGFVRPQNLERVLEGLRLAGMPG
jgi:hypothetical protein